MKPHIIGVAGGSCSGKTTLVSHIKKEYDTKVSVISFDDYFDQSVIEKRSPIDDWEDPSLYRYDDYKSNLQKLQHGELITYEAHSRESRASGERVKTVAPSGLVIIEGFLIFHWPELHEFYDTKVFLDVSESTMVKRRLARSLEPNRWNDPNYIHSKVIPGYIRYVLPQKDAVDFVINGERSELEVYTEFKRLIDRWL